MKSSKAIVRKEKEVIDKEKEFLKKINQSLLFITYPKKMLLFRNNWASPNLSFWMKKPQINKLRSIKWVWDHKREINTSSLSSFKNIMILEQPSDLIPIKRLTNLSIGNKWTHNRIESKRILINLWRYLHWVKCQLKITRLVIGRRELQHIVNHSSHLSALIINDWSIDFEGLRFKDDIKFKLKHLKIDVLPRSSKPSIEVLYSNFKNLLEAISKSPIQKCLKKLDIGHSNLRKAEAKSLLNELGLKTLMIMTNLGGRSEKVKYFI